MHVSKDGKVGLPERLRREISQLTASTADPTIAALAESRPAYRRHDRVQIVVVIEHAEPEIAVRQARVE